MRYKVQEVTLGHNYFFKLLNYDRNLFTLCKEPFINRLHLYCEGLKYIKSYNKSYFFNFFSEDSISYSFLKFSVLLYLKTYPHVLILKWAAFDPGKAHFIFQDKKKKKSNENKNKEQGRDQPETSKPKDRNQKKKLTNRFVRNCQNLILSVIRIN